MLFFTSQLGLNDLYLSRLEVVVQHLTLVGAVASPDSVFWTPEWLESEAGGDYGAGSETAYESLADGTPVSAVLLKSIRVITGSKLRAVSLLLSLAGRESFFFFFFFLLFLFVIMFCRFFHHNSVFIVSKFFGIVSRMGAVKITAVTEFRTHVERLKEEMVALNLPEKLMIRVQKYYGALLVFSHPTSV